jgi:hypothetical protein
MVTHSRTPVRVDRLRALNEPVQIDVELDTCGRLCVISYPRSPDNAIERTAVDVVIDSWRINDEWWRNPISRRYLDIVLEGGGHVIVFQDLVTGDWFLQKP